MNTRPPYLRSVGNTVLAVDPFTALHGWLQLRFNLHGSPVLDLANIVRAIEAHPDTKERFWFDEFSGRIMTGWECTTRPLNKNDAVRLTVWLQNAVGLHSVDDRMVHKAMRAVALRHVRNAPRDWMESLRWDGEQRLATSLSTYLGAEDTEHKRAAALEFWTSMVTRVYHPGCEVGNVLMLQNSDSATLSLALNVIGESWYWRPCEDLPRRDLYSGLRGTMLVELSNPADLSWRVLTRSMDYFRAPYAHEYCEQHRGNVFVVAMEGDWDMPETVWQHLMPVTCNTIDVESLAHDREQLFSEAVHLYNAREFLI